MKKFRAILVTHLSTILYNAQSFGIPAPERLRRLLEHEMNGTRNSSVPIILPCCYDGLSARLIARAGFEATFMTGFGVSGELHLTLILSKLANNLMNVSTTFARLFP